MKIGIMNAAYISGGVADYERAKRHGYDCMDYQSLCNTKGEMYSMTEAELEKTLVTERKRANDAGIEFSQVHAPWPVDDSTVESRAQKLEDMKRTIRGAAYLDGKYMVTHPTRLFDPQGHELPEAVEENIDFFGKITEYAKGFGVGICIETMPFRRSGDTISSPQSIIDFVNKANLDNLYICLDTGHANLYGVKPADAVKMFGKKLKTLHIHDNDGYDDNHWVPYLGSVDWTGFGKALAEVGFDGCMSSECRVMGAYSPSLKKYFEVAPEVKERYEIELANTVRQLINS